MNTDNYLRRLGIDGTIRPGLESLKKLHRLHLYNIPFENLDIHYGKKIVPDTGLFLEKISHNNRGGYCYELNGLFHSLLESLGFSTKMVSARVSNGKGGWGPEFDHLAIIVNLGEEWLADVGFGDSFIEPIRLKPGLISEDPAGKFLIDDEGDGGFTLYNVTTGDAKEPMYRFTALPRSLNEFAEMNNYQQFSPDSHFRKQKLITKPIPGGRITLTEKVLKITRDGIVTSEDIKDETDFAEKLRSYFGIDEDKLRV